MPADLYVAVTDVFTVAYGAESFIRGGTVVRAGSEVLREHPGCFTELVLYVADPDLDVAEARIAITGGEYQPENGVPVLVRLKRERTEPPVPVGP